MNAEEIEHFLSKIKTALLSLILAICVISSILVYLVTNNLWLGLGALAGLAIIGFVCYRLFLSVLFVNFMSRFFSPVVTELNRHSHMMVHILDMSVTGRMLPVTRDELIYCILLAEGHKSIFCHILKFKECTHILLALHESLDRNIANFRSCKPTLTERFVLEQLKTLKEQLPSVE